MTLLLLLRPHRYGTVSTSTSTIPLAAPNLRIGFAESTPSQGFASPNPARGVT